MEPVYMVEIDCPSDCIQAVFNILSRRRGHVIKDGPKPGTPLQTLLAFLPIIDSFGFETDLRLHTHGQGFALCWFDHWEIVPGDPLLADIDSSIKPLQASPPQILARDFLLKTRRRKGLCEEILLDKYIDDIISLGLSRPSI
jgi:U5 small nuclear ribonucleoprotein component